MIINKKNKIELSDYNFSRDLETRLLMAQLNCLEVELLREILDGSLKFTVEQLAECILAENEVIYSLLDKLCQAKLLTYKHDDVLVDKDMRKYYQIQISKFDERFVPDMEFLISLLSKVPIHVLPTWYSISRTSDNIIGSIIEKYLASPRMYEKYLQELQFEDSVLIHIKHDVFAAQDHKIDAEVLRKKYNLSHEDFEKCMLFLEYHFVCFLSYEKDQHGWREVVTPLYEWREYLKFLQETTPESIKDIAKIEKFEHQSNEFQFSERDLREIRRSLKPLSHLGWIYFEDYMKGLTATICNAEPIALKSKGKKWKYVIPSYNEEEVVLIQEIVFGRLYDSGIVEIGLHNNRPCFCVTSFGRLSIE